MRICELKALIANLPDDALIGVFDQHGYLREAHGIGRCPRSTAQYGDGERLFNKDDFYITTVTREGDGE